MTELFAEMLTSLREGQKGLDRELQPLLQARDPDWTLWSAFSMWRTSTRDALGCCGRR
jgi:hypothetical protein